MNSWDEKYNMSMNRIDEDISILRSYFPSATKVVKTPKEVDRLGADYVISFGTEYDTKVVFVDAKSRSLSSCETNFQRDQLGNMIPEFALEICSVTQYRDYKFIPERGDKVGWTLNDTSIADYILYTYPDGCVHKSFLVPFQLLRLAFRNNYKKWTTQYGIHYQQSDSWYSVCVFVNAYEVLDAIYSEITR